MLTVLDQVTHALDALLRSLDILTKDHPNTGFVTVFRLVIVAVVAMYQFVSRTELGDIEGKPVCSLDCLEVSTNPV